METKTFTVDNILVLMTWGSDKKVYVKYFQNNAELYEWELVEIWQKKSIDSYYTSYCSQHMLILWSY